MLQAFNTLVRPSQAELEKTLGINKIEVTYISSELKAKFKYKRVNIQTKQLTHGVQFDPLGELAFQEGRK